MLLYNLCMYVLVCIQAIITLTGDSNDNIFKQNFKLLFQNEVKYLHLQASRVNIKYILRCINRIWVTTYKIVLATNLVFMLKFEVLTSSISTSEKLYCNIQGDRKYQASRKEPVWAYFRTSEVQKCFYVFPRLGANYFQVRNLLQM